MQNAKDVKAKNAENSKNLITAAVTDSMTVRVYSKSRAKGEVKFKKQRNSLTFKSAAEANAAINTMVDAGAKVRKVELIAADGTVTATYKPTRVRLTPTAEEKAAAKAAKAEIKAQKLAAKEAAKAEAKAAREAAKAEKATAKKTATKTATKTTKPAAARLTDALA